MKDNKRFERIPDKERSAEPKKKSSKFSLSDGIDLLSKYTLNEEEKIVLTLSTSNANKNTLQDVERIEAKNGKKKEFCIKQKKQKSN